MKTTWLHVSDLHMHQGDPYNRETVLQALVASVPQFRGRGFVPDLIFITGDIAYSGKAQEYELATRFLDDLLDATHLEKDRLYVVPGNHDVDRRLGVALVRTLESPDHADAYFDPAIPKSHLLLKQQAFLEWYNRYFQGIRRMPQDSTCGPVEVVDIRGLKIAVLPINSALFCQDESDHQKLWIGCRCLKPAIEHLQACGARIIIGLIHHPLSWLNGMEQMRIRQLLYPNVNVVMQGHLHQSEFYRTIPVGSGAVLHLAAGAAYQTRQWPKRAIYAMVEGDEVAVCPIRYEEEPEVWTVDTSAFFSEDTYVKSFPIQAAARFLTRSPVLRPDKLPFSGGSPSNVPPRYGLPFIGRDGLLDVMQAQLREPSRESILVLHGQAGVGKSELAREYARRYRTRYPGGTFFIDVAGSAVPIDLARIGRDMLNLDFPYDLPLRNQCLRTLHALSAAPTLLIYDNVHPVHRVAEWLPAAGIPCHVLVTTAEDQWGPGWSSLEVPPLSLEDSRQLIDELAGPDVSRESREQLAHFAGGLPVEICPRAAALRKQARRERLEPDKLGLSAEVAGSSQDVYTYLESPAQLLLHAGAFFDCQRIARKELFRPLAEATQWDEKTFGSLLDECRELHLVDGDEELRMHQRFRSFILDVAPGPENAQVLRRVRVIQGRRLVEAAQDVEANPADPEPAAILLALSHTPHRWVEAGVDIPTQDSQTIGHALSEIGRFDEALSWNEYTVKNRQQARPNEAPDHESLSKCQREVGYCLSSVGRFEEAREWYERAVESALKGDRDGRIDHESLSRSLHRTGDCLLETGQFREARTWYERAAKHAQEGDLSGRVNYESLGLSLHSVAYCLAKTDHFEEARGWYHRAVEAKQKGDVYGRVHHDSLGMSLHSVAHCFATIGEFKDAWTWYDKAIEAGSKGDVHGRINHESLGTTWHEMGYCLARQDKFEEALIWYQRAVDAKREGDVYGRVDHESLGRTLRWMGRCLLHLDRFEEARPWFQQAAEAALNGDIHRRVDHETLGRCYHEMGDSFSRANRPDQAIIWYERAVEAKQKGDLHGCVNEESLALSCQARVDCGRRLGDVL